MSLRSPFSILKNFIWVILVTSLLSFSLSLCDPEVTCGTSKVEADNTNNLVQNFITVMDSLAEVMKGKHWGIRSVRDLLPNVYGLAQCYHFLDGEACELCFAQARNSISHCLPSTSGRTYLDGCFLRYDKYEFYGETLDDDYDTHSCGVPTGGLGYGFTQLDFRKKVDILITNVTNTAPKEKGYACSSIHGDIDIYAMGTCLKTISKRDCRMCLTEAALKVKNCTPGADGIGFYTGCVLRYSTTKFLPNDERDTEALREWLLNTVRNPLAMVLSSLAIVFAGIAAYLGYRFFKKSNPKKKVHNRSTSSRKKLSLNFEYEELEKATHCFDEKRKVGQGGAGSVYKGTLSDGNVVAVKRLFFNTRQWADLFFNEVNLISGAQHKNLVKLLGCSIEGPECLIVYEYVPNKSLDKVLFQGKDKGETLSWQQRYNIILGVAEGLAYLHSGKEVKVIHRDIKCGNILLDENLEPKIADFGLARCVVNERTHISTEIRGTLGYMAPEYLLRGQLTEKADLYSFGVLVIEIATGRKNSIFVHGSGSVLHSVWKNYNSKTITESIDPCLKGEFPVEEASTALQIGLLCTQSSIAIRPSMDEVLKMLKDKSCSVPSPKQPPFLNASFLGSDDATDSCSIDLVDDEQASYT